MKRKDLKPGMYLRNGVTGNLGEVHGQAQKPRELHPAHPLFVAVRVWSTKSERWSYPYWRLAHVKVAPAE